MRAITKIRRSIRAISPVISVLLMIAIAVAASLVAYAWVMGYMGFTTTKVSKAIMIQSTASYAGKMYVYVQNVGQSPVTFDPKGSVYINDELQNGLTDASFDGKTTLNPGETAVIRTGYDWADNLKTRVVTTDGTSTEKNGNAGGTNIAAASVTSAQLSDSSVSVGDSVTVTATVTPSEVTGGLLFQFSTDGSTWNDLGSPKTLSSGPVTSDSYTATSVGTVYFRAIYSGDANYLGSQSGDTAEALTIGVATPGLSAPQLNPSSPIILGDSVTATVTVSGSAGNPTGTVTFHYSSDGGSHWSTLGAVKDLSGGSATSDLYTPSTVGSNYLINAVYSGDSKYDSATSQASLTVNPVPFAVESSATASITSGTVLTINLETHRTNELLYVSVESSGANAYVSSVSGGGLTWVCRQGASHPDCSYNGIDYYSNTYWAAYSSKGAITITITLNAATTSAAAVVVGVSAADTVSPFDGNCVYNSGYGSPGRAPSRSFNANRLIIGAIGLSTDTASLPTLTPDSSFTIANTATQSSGANRHLETSIESWIVPTTQSLSVGYTFNPSGGYGRANNADAIKPAP